VSGLAADAGSADVAHLAKLLADDTRALFCVALLDGRSWTAGELARYAGVAPSTATEHLNRLIAGGIVAERRQGRYRYVHIADPHVAQSLESLAALLTPTARVRSLRGANVSAALAGGRTCYDHLAGRLGVEITEAMTRQGLIQQDTGFAVTEAGLEWLNTTLGFDAATHGQTRRPVARACLDWTERRIHLAGTAGAHICQYLLSQQWIARTGNSRAVRVTEAGVVPLRRLFGVDVATIT
jgi:DNA-binding transcriptional ArsR family regulator